MLRSYREQYNFICTLVSQMSRDGIGERVVIARVEDGGVTDKKLREREKMMFCVFCCKSKERQVGGKQKKQSIV